MSIDFEIPAEAKAIRLKVRQWVHDECKPAEKRLVDQESFKTVLAELRAKARAQGVQDELAVAEENALRDAGGAGGVKQGCRRIFVEFGKREARCGLGQERFILAGERNLGGRNRSVIRECEVGLNRVQMGNQPFDQGEEIRVNQEHAATAVDDLVEPALAHTGRDLRGIEEGGRLLEVLGDEAVKPTQEAAIAGVTEEDDRPPASVELGAELGQQPALLGRAPIRGAGDSGGDLLSPGFVRIPDDERAALLVREVEIRRQLGHRAPEEAGTLGAPIGLDPGDQRST